MTVSIILIAAATLLSLLWLGIYASILGGSADWPGLAGLPPGELAVALLGGALPLAAIWLAAALAAQALAIRRHDRATRLAGSQTRRTAEEVESLARAVIVTQEQLRRQSFLDGTDLVLKDLTSHLAQFMERIRIVDPEEAETLWALTAAGDIWAFPNKLLVRAKATGEAFEDLIAERLLEDGHASGALQRFLRRFEQLADRARQDDETRLLQEVLEDGPLDQVAVLLGRTDSRMRMMLGEPMAPPVDGMDASPPDATFSPGTTQPPVDDYGFEEAGVFHEEPLPDPVDDPAHDNAAEADPFAVIDALEDQADRDLGLGPAPDGQNQDYGRQPESLHDHVPAGGRPPKDEPVETPRDIARRIPYPPLDGEEMSSVRERVARKLSRTVLSDDGVARAAQAVEQKLGSDPADEEDQLETLDMFYEEPEDDPPTRRR